MQDAGYRMQDARCGMVVGDWELGVRD